MNQRYNAPHQNASAMPAAVSAAPAQVVSPGWFPDPWGEGPDQERWWDGVNWSREFARGPQISSQAAPTAAAPLQAGAAQFVTGEPAETREDNTPGSIIAIVVGLVLIGARIAYMSNHADPGQNAAYQQGATAGNIVGMFVSSFIFSWGFTRRLNGDNFTPSQTLPIAIGITVVALIVTKLFF